MMFAILLYIDNKYLKRDKGVFKLLRAKLKYEKEKFI